MATPTPNSKKLYWGTPGTTEATLYTVPASTSTFVKEIWLCNTTSAAATFSLSIVNSGGTAGTSNRIIAAKSIPANDIVVIACQEHMDTGDFISGLQGTSSAINVRITGVEVA
jgi:fructose-specific phosphotransferase system component IIB